MPMNNRLLRPRQTIHPEAADWANRVRTNGGSVSGTTLTAVDKFVKAVYTAGIRDRFYRLNLFCGTSDASLNAVRTPLFRGPSLAGTQYGNTIDTNVAFTQSDYAETGAGGGLLGNGSSKYLLTGTLPSDAGGSLHMAVSVASGLANAQIAIGADNAFDSGWTTASIDFSNALGALRPRSALSSNNGVNFAETVSASTACRILCSSARTTGATQLAYFNGSLSATNTPAYQTQPAFGFAVFGTNRKGTGVGISSMRLSSYSVGADMTAAQAQAYSAALAAFLAALGRNV